MIRSALGMGTVCVVTADLDVGFIAEWKGRDRLVASLLDDLMGTHSQGNDRPDESRRNSAVTHLGFSDLSGQLRAALDQFPGVRLVPFSLIAGVALLFVILIGPMDYFVLRRFAPRMEWTWLTFPLTLLGVSGLALGLANSWKGATPKRNVVDLLDIDTVTGTTRCTSWAHLYPVNAGQFPIDAEPNLEILDATAWESEPPDDSFRGKACLGLALAGCKTELRRQHRASPIR